LVHLVEEVLSLLGIHDFLAQFSLELFQQLLEHGLHCLVSFGVHAFDLLLVVGDKGVRVGVYGVFGFVEVGVRKFVFKLG
jgi:hypothetical protein